MARKTIVVLGGYGSGVTAATAARENDEEARIVLVDPGGEASSTVATAPYAISGETASVNALSRGRPEALAASHGIELRAAVGANRIDAGSRRLHLADGVIEYTALVHALGAETTPDPKLPTAENVQRLRTLADLEAIRASLAPGGRVCVLGGSPTAVDAADAFRRGGYEVTIVHSGPRILADFSEMGSARAAASLRAFGVTVVVGDSAAGAEVVDGRLRSLALAGGTMLPADLVLVTGPLRPQSDLLRAAGAELNEDGSVIVDEYCLTSLPHVFACGASVSVPHAVTAWPVWLPQAGVADRTAMVAGACAAGGKAELAPVLNTSIVRAGDLTIARTGLAWDEAVEYASEEEVGEVSVHGSSCERTLSASQPIVIDLVYHRGDGRILGAEVAGKAGADKRVDVLSAAIVGRMTVERISALDLAYAPPFSTTRDVVNVAGGVAAAARAGLARPWTAHDLQSRSGDVVIVDVEPERGRAGEITDSLVIPLAELRSRIGALPRNRPIVFVSETGRLGYVAARIAHLRGFKDAGFLTGGLLSWQAAGLPVKQGSKHR
jgi:NADPH-dependent 2,4-dienoyl-CoA reductase/sulfur reductase-like enzyme/rhodanese-related sulfurtransferase